MKFQLSGSPSFGKSYLNPWWGVMKLLPAYLHGSFPAESHTKLLSSYPFWVTPFAQTRSQKNKHREGRKFDFMSLWKIYWSSSTTVRKIHQGRNMSCSPWHGTAPMGMTWQDQISCWEMEDVHLHAHYLLLWLKTWFTEFQLCSQLLEQHKAGRNTDLQHQRQYTQLAPGSNKLASWSAGNRKKQNRDATYVVLCKKNSFTQGWGFVCF